MPFDDEPSMYESRLEPSAEADEWARRVIGACIEVHRQLGPGYLEEVYEAALAVELGLREIPFERQVQMTVNYKGHVVGRGKADFIVAGCLIVELKACDCFAPIHTAQVISYLACTKLVLGLLINFHVPVLKEGIKRIIRST